MCVCGGVIYKCWYIERLFNIFQSLEVTVESGSLGISALWDSGTDVTILENCQESLKQLEKGKYWRIVSVDGEPYTSQLIEEKIHGEASYKLIFIKSVMIYLVILCMANIVNFLNIA